MPGLVSAYWSWMVSGTDLSTRNLVTLLVSIALYWFFLSRDRERPSGRTHRPSRCPDSVLRGGGD